MLACLCSSLSVSVPTFSASPSLSIALCVPVAVFITDFLITVAMHKGRDEVDGEQAVTCPCLCCGGSAVSFPVGLQGATDPSVQLPESRSANPFHPEALKVKWGKAKLHSTSMFVGLVNLLFLIMSLVGRRVEGVVWCPCPELLPHATPSRTAGTAVARGRRPLLVRFAPVVNQAVKGVRPSRRG